MYKILCLYMHIHYMIYKIIYKIQANYFLKNGRALKQGCTRCSYLRPLYLNATIQSACRQYHSCETALVRVVNDILLYLLYHAVQFADFCPTEPNLNMATDVQH